jgi:hypothetical protein
MEEKWLKKIPIEKGWYLAGFVDGEGSFNVSIIKRKDYKLGWKVTPSFNVSQRDKTILFLLKRYLGCGRIKQRKDGLWIYVVENPRALEEKVTPFFRRYRFLSSRAKTNFSIFTQIIKLIRGKSHLTKKGFKKILELRAKLNKGRKRKRKYKQSDIQISGESSETIRRAEAQKDLCARMT